MEKSIQIKTMPKCIMRPMFKKMTEEDSINAYFENKKANFKIKMGLAEINNNLFRVDPINTLEVYSIKSITLSDFWGNS